MAIQDKIYNYFERYERLHVLFIFDHTGMIEEEVQDIEWPEDYIYLKPRGGWFSIKYRLDREWAGKKVVMLFSHQSPATFKQEFPLMDVLKANLEYHEQDYAAFMQQHHIKSEFATYISRHVVELQSEKMLKLLEPLYADGTFSIDMANRAFLSQYIGSPKMILEWPAIIIKLILLADTGEEKKRQTFFNKLDKNIDARNALNNKLERTFGEKLQVNTAERVNMVVKKMKYNAITQSLPVNPADPYKQLRINDAFALQDINYIMEQAANDNKCGEQFRRVIATLASDIHEQEIVSVYGAEADYWTVSPKMAWAMVQALIDDKITAEPQEALDRLNEIKMKCIDHDVIADVVEFATFTAKYYDAYKSIKSFKLSKPDDFVNSYCSELYLVDFYYRRAVNSFYAIDPTIPVFASIENAKSLLDNQYHKFANLLNLEWTDRLQSGGGMRQVALTRQQDFYEKYVKPLNGKVVVVISDALRYEVASQLADKLKGLKHPLNLESALAMLPTETCYCKPSLLPHSTLHIVEPQKMLVDGNVLNETSSRQKHLQLFSPKAKCKTYKTVIETPWKENRALLKEDVLWYVYHDTIDEGSHGNKTSKAITDSCERAVDELFSLVNSLHSSCDATHVIVTSDHGFLFNDIKFEEKDKQPVADEILERKPRYYITHSGQPESQIVKMALKDVSAMDNDDLFVAVPLGTNRLFAPGGDYVFCHGGASLQEMIIPVIVSHRKTEKKTNAVNAMVLEQNLRMTSSRVKFTILQTETVSNDKKERNIVCAIYDGDKMVSPQVSISLNRSDASLDARKFPVELTLNQATSASVLQLRIYDIEDPLNIYLKTNITNNTLIEMDF